MLQTGSTSATGSVVCFGGPSPSSVDTLGVRDQQPPDEITAAGCKLPPSFTSQHFFALAFRCIGLAAVLQSLAVCSWRTATALR